MKTDKKTLSIKPLDYYSRDEDEVVGNLDVRIKLTLCDLPERTTQTYSESAASIFNGHDWGREIVWTVAQLMKKKFGYSKKDILDAFEEVIKNL